MFGATLIDAVAAVTASGHASITQAVELGQKAGVGVDKIRARSRHSSIATLMPYVENMTGSGRRRRWRTWSAVR